MMMLMGMTMILGDDDDDVMMLMCVMAMGECDDDVNHRLASMLSDILLSMDPFTGAFSTPD